MGTIFTPYKNCNFTGTVLWYYHRAWVTCGTRHFQGLVNGLGSLGMRSGDPLMFLQLQANQKTQQDEIENRLKEIQQEVNMNNQYLFCEILFFEAKKMPSVASQINYG